MLTHLTVQGLPVEDKGSKGIRVQLFPLSTLEVSEEAEAMLAKALQQHRTGRRLPISPTHSQTHGVRYVRTLNSLLEPGSKLLHRVQGGQMSLLKCLGRESFISFNKHIECLLCTCSVLGTFQVLTHLVLITKTRPQEGSVSLIL